VYRDLPGDGPRQRKSDITLAKEESGWEPGMQLEEGLESTIVYVDELLKSGAISAASS